MSLLNNRVISVVLLSLITIVYLEGLSLHSVKRDTDAEIRNRILRVGSLNFSAPVFPQATERRKISCFFVFDKEASEDLNNNQELAHEYANQLASLASRYTAIANTVVINAGVEMWRDPEPITIPAEGLFFTVMPDVVEQFQNYLNKIYPTLFGTRYAVAVLLSKRASVINGYSQGPPCTTSGISLIKYQQIPWVISGLLAHELAHTLAVVHPDDLSGICDIFPQIDFCKNPKGIPPECLCNNATHFPPQQCIMTSSFGGARVNAAKFTVCDIQMMNYFSSNIPCLLQ